MEIKQEKITKVTNFLNDLRILINRGNGMLDNKDKQKIHNKYSLPYSFFSIARDMGYFTKVGDKKYVVGKVLFEPIHSRKVIEKHTEYHRAAQARNRESLKEIAKDIKEIKETKKEPKPLKEVKVKNVVLQPKTFSLFWGLIKINY